MKKEPEHKWMDWSHITIFKHSLIRSTPIWWSFAIVKQKDESPLTYDIHSRIDALKPLLTDLNQIAERINLKKS
jgi:hypothetical protein